MSDVIVGWGHTKFGKFESAIANGRLVQIFGVFLSDAADMRVHTPPSLKVIVPRHRCETRTPVLCARPAPVDAARGDVPG